jgi:hypothetical protein
MCTNAFGNGRRKGVVMGCEGGTGFLWVKGEVDSAGSTWSFDYSNRRTFAMNLLIVGYGITNKGIIEVFFPRALYLKGNQHETKVAGMIFPVGLRYYTEPTSPSLFLFGGVGFPFFVRFGEESGEDVRRGLSFYGGIGYEFIQHFHVSLEHMIGLGAEGKYHYEGRAECKFVSVSLNVGVMFY